VSLRLALFYVAIFLVIGIQLPFWPVWLASRGMGPGEIGVLLAAAGATRIVVAPAIAPLADRLGRRRPIVIALAAGALIATAIFAVTYGFWALLAVSVLAAAFFTVLLPMVESLTVIAARDHGVDYGRVRLWGSLAFILAATGGGQMLSRLDAALVLWLVLGALALTFAASLALPDLRTPRTARGAGRMRLFLRREFVLFILATSLMQASHAVYYGFATLHWRAAGHSETLIGALWAEGVIAEVALFAVSGAAIAARIAPVPLLVIAAAGGAARWSVLGLTDAVWALACAQALHALTFGASHLAAIRFILREVPAEMTSTAQSLYYSVAGGIVSALFMLGAGWLYAGFGAHAYFAMAAASIAGGAVALAAGRLKPATA